MESVGFQEGARSLAKAGVGRRPAAQDLVDRGGEAAGAVRQLLMLLLQLADTLRGRRLAEPQLAQDQIFLRVVAEVGVGQAVLDDGIDDVEVCFLGALQVLDLSLQGGQ